MVHVADELKGLSRGLLVEIDALRTAFNRAKPEFESYDTLVVEYRTTTDPLRQLDLIEEMARRKKLLDQFLPALIELNARRRGVQALYDAVTQGRP